MSQSGGSPSGVTHLQLQSAINGLRIEFKGEIKTLMKSIESMARQLERAIDIQTAAIVAGVAATTTAVVSTKSEISDTRTQLSEKLSLQLRSELQLELGRKLNVARSASAKFKQFFQDIRSRFDKSLEGIFVNRIEYDERFNQIFEEYNNKIRNIGDHIFKIRDEIGLVEASCSQSLENIYSLPMEVDLYRLEQRSEELDQTVAILEASRLQEIKNSLGNLKSALKMLSYQQGGETQQRIGLEALYVASTSGNWDLLLGAKAIRPPGGSIDIDNSVLENSTSEISDTALIGIAESLEARQKRPLTEIEYEELGQAIRTLSEDGIISPDDAILAKAMFESRKVSVLY